MYQGCKKYIPFVPVSLPNRTWPNNRIEKAPTWCSVDLRDGNQALVTPMNLQEKLDFFKLLVDIGFKEIEVGFPSASETEYEILRALIDGHLYSGRRDHSGAGAGARASDPQDVRGRARRKKRHYPFL